MKKNLVYVFADQWRFHAIGCSNEDDVCTPYMDSFASESLICTGAVSSYPLCSPHRAALMTGKHPLSCGMWTNCKTGLNEKICLSPDEITIHDVLHDAGYETAYVGKWHLDESEQNYSSRPRSGAEEWDAYTPPGERRHHIGFWYSYGAMNDHLHPHYWHDDERQINADQWSAQHDTDIALRWLKDRKDKKQPFSLFISWNPPHPPYDSIPVELVSTRDRKIRENVPEEMRNNEVFLKNMREYFSAVEGLDYQFGRIIGFLKTEGLYDDTVIVLSSDHGDCMGSHGLYGKNYWWDESIRIPLVIKADCFEKGSVSDAIVASEDHMPTILDILGVDIPSTCEGLSLKNVLSGKKGISREYCYLTMIPGMPEQAKAYSSLGLDRKCFGWRGIRTQRYTYVVDNGIVPGTERRRFLFDSLADPYQMNGEVLSVLDKRASYYDVLIRKTSEKLNDPFLL